MEPNITAHFEDIHKVLLREIGSAEHYIVAAVAWFTDREILNALRQRASHGVSVRVAITDDELNLPPKAPTFDALIDLGGEVHRISPGSRSESLMHLKFCVIDGTTVISGSFNWTHHVYDSKENVTLIRNDSSFATSFMDTFEQIVAKRTDGVSTLDTDRIRKRLELIRNFIQLGEVEDLLPHTQRLRGVADKASLSKVLTAIDTSEYTKALEEIEQWLKRASALVVAEDTDVTYLRLQLQALELGVTALSTEHADLERRLVVFNRRHDDALGDLIQAVLGARSELKRLQAEKARRDEWEHAEEAEEAAQFAENQYHEYAEEHFRVQAEPPHKELDAESEKTLKQMYRSACRLCHPDKVEEVFKTKATEIFQQLNAAYHTQDIESVRDILNMLQTGSLNLDARSDLLTEASRLRGAIAQVEHQIATTVAALHALKASSAVRLMESVGYSEEAWVAYVDRCQRELREELHTLEQKIEGARS